MQWPPLAPLTAMIYILGSVGLYHAQPDQQKVRQKVWVSRSCAFMIVALSMTKLAEHVFGWRWHFEMLGFQQPFNVYAVAQPVGLAPFTTIGLTMTGIALWMASCRRYRLIGTFQVLTVLIGLVGWLGFSHILYGGEPLFPFGPMTFGSSVCLLGLSLGLLNVREEGGVIQLLISESAGGLLARRLMLPAILIPFVVGWFRLKAQEAGWFGTEAGLALFALSNVALFSTLVLFTARAVHRNDVQRRQAEETNMRLAAIVESSHDAIIGKTLDGIITSWNSGAEKIFGYTARECIGKSVLMIFPPERFDEEPKILQRIRHGERVEHFDTIRVTKDGRRINVSATVSPVRDEKGNIVSASSIARDVTAEKQAELALRESEERLRIVTQNARVGLVLISQSRQYLFANAAYAEILNLPTPNITGQNIADVLADVYEKQIRPRLDQGFAGERVVYELQRTRPEGECFYLVRYEPIYVGEIVSHIMVVIIDITERKRAAETLRKSQEQLLSLVEQAPVSIAMLDREMRYIIASRSWITEFGRGQEKLAGMSHYDIYPDLPQEQKNIHQRGLAGEFLRNDEDLWVMADGQQRWLRWAVQPWRDGNGTIGGIIISAEEITKHKLAEQSLRESEEKFRQLAENINEVFWMSDLAKKQVLYVSPAFEKIWGQSCEKLYAAPETWLDAVHPEDREHIAKAAREKQTTGCYDEEYRIIRPDKQMRWIHDIAFPIRNAAGAVYRIVGTAEDITTRKTLEEQFRQAQKMESIGQLAGGVAHDFNNILAVIQMQSELLKSAQGTTPDQLEIINEIGTTVQRAASLTRQLLLFSRREVFQPREMDLSDSIANMTKMLRRILGEDIRMEFRLASQPMFVNADAGMMDQVLMNLTVNARDAMPNGGHLIIETSGVDIDEFAAAQSAQMRAGSFVRLSVSDSGCGIAPEILPRIFEPFFTTKDVGKGTGLGLATVFGIVHQHQGWINVYSEVGHGTTFRIYLPRLAKNGKAKVSDSPLASLPGGTETILLVEDDTSLRESVHKMLSRLGYRVLTASSGLKALDVWQQHHQEINLLLTDMVMPDGVNGKDLAQKISQENPKLKIIFMSGYSADVAGKDFPLKEGENFLTKPFRVINLAQTLRKVLDS